MNTDEFETWTSSAWYSSTFIGGWDWIPSFESIPCRPKNHRQHLINADPEKRVSGISVHRRSSAVAFGYALKKRRGVTAPLG
jgi:hypothetical protein